MSLANSFAILQVLRTRILSYVPAALVLPTQSGPVSLTTAGVKVWLMQAQDQPTFPYVTIAWSDRVRDGSTHGLVETFGLEIDCWHRPRNLANLTMLSAIADQVEVSLTDYAINDAGPGKIKTMTMRRNVWPYTGSADRDVCREYMRFAGWMTPAYANVEVGTS